MDDFLPNPQDAAKIMARFNAKQVKEQKVFVDDDDLEKASECSCTVCPSRERLDRHDYCCKSLFLYPLNKRGKMLKDGLDSKLKERGSSPCITMDKLFCERLITEVSAEAAVALHAYQNGHEAKDPNECLLLNDVSAWFVGESSLRGKCIDLLRTRNDVWTGSTLRSLLTLLKSAKRNYLCSSHFQPIDFIDLVLRPDSVPNYNDPTVLPTTVTAATGSSTVPATVSPPSLSGILPTFDLSSSFNHHSSPMAIAPSPHSSFLPPPIPLIDRSIPPCCRCCCRPEQKKEIDQDPNWSPSSATTKGSKLSEYLVISNESLISILRKCTSCIGGERSLNVRMEGMAVSCSGECEQCGAQFDWRSSSKLPTANVSNKERLYKVNLDITTGAIISSVGGAKLRQFLFTSGISTLSSQTFHRMKKLYIIPAVNEHFFNSQAIIIEGIRERIAKGERIHLCGDGSFDSRGYSAAWCRYFLLDAESGVALHYVLIHKSDTGSSSTMEVAALERSLNELSLMIGGTEGIASVVTDRHGSVIKMMRNKFPGIEHYFDPWHFIRNITLSLLKICKASYMTPVRFWVKPIINRCYDAIVSAQGNGELASEKFRAIPLCMQGIHKFDQDPSFKLFKECTHSPPTNPSIFIPKGGKILKRLEALIRNQMVEAPDTTERKRKEALAKKKEMWALLTRPAVPHPMDANLDWSSDEEEDEDDGIVPPILTPLVQLHSLADANLEETDEENDEE
ncbi:hypothetical protein PRIPAC_78938 [Pristionchus pacificus]|uniref:Mutator-like transposase domain-containing protein n=1 Tax=Pristionchus pacificus TaxID=54126 RepID=A0A2A6BWG8_PRIPA|nr:hypothetical protein PRIPAC_78938 [Pristionchus pacificus]|eukprot:PDM70260.1 hypothetical protein PRIPAC_46506 [Pristionchus pacificus]